MRTSGRADAEVVHHAGRDDGVADPGGEEDADRVPLGRDRAGPAQPSLQAHRRDDGDPDVPVEELQAGIAAIRLELCRTCHRPQSCSRGTVNLCPTPPDQ